MYLQSGYSMLYVVKCIHLKHITKSTVWNEKNKKRERRYMYILMFLQIIWVLIILKKIYKEAFFVLIDDVQHTLIRVVPAHQIDMA
jgi:hypothetical protein